MHGRFNCLLTYMMDNLQNVYCGLLLETRDHVHVLPFSVISTPSAEAGIFRKSLGKTMAANALAPCVASASAAMLLSHVG